MITMSAVDITVTTVLGFVLVFTWLRERGVRLVGWWGLITLLQAAGVVLASYAALRDDARVLTLGLALMVLSESLKWTASREFANRTTSPAWVLVGPAGFLLVAHSGYLDSLLSVLFFDLDHFKDVNDTFGHDTGDRVLKLFAGTAARCLKDRGMIARTGGEEFAAVLPGMDAAEAAETAEAVRQAFAKAAAEVDGRDIGTAVSVGIASRSGDACDSSDLGALFRQADAALYAAKRAGRNRVEFADPDGASIPGMKATVRTSPRGKSPAEGRFVVNA